MKIAAGMVPNNSKKGIEVALPPRSAMAKVFLTLFNTV
jgi:uncharacterized membrane protein YagU involved in acid resistance